jgi:hypothetical protein
MAIVWAAACGIFAAGWFTCAGKRSSVRRCVAWMGGCSLCAAAIIGLAASFPDWFAVRLSRYCALSYALQLPDARLRYSRWNALSHVDVVESSAIHLAPGLSLGYLGAAPVELGLYVDTHARGAILNDERAVIDEWSGHLLEGLPFYLRPNADALVLEPGGGLDVAVASSLGARHVVAVSFDPLAIEAVRRFGAGLYAKPEVEVVTRSPRSFVRGAQRLEERFDIVDLALTDAQQMVISGAYTLSEDYRYTLQAFRDYMSLLKPGGLLVVQRWLQTPPSESLRAWATAVESLERYSHVAPEQSLVAVRSWATMVILVKNGAFSADELRMVRQFCDERQFDLVYLADMGEAEANRYNQYPGAPYWHAFHGLLFGPRETFYRDQDYDVRPPTDDRPFFLHFFKWRQVREILQGLGKTWQPFGGGGYLILMVLLVVALLACTGLVMLPLLLARGGRLAAGPIGGSRWRAIVYFGCLGLGYLGVEIPLIQRFVLLVDHAAIAFATVVSVLLISSGMGSLLSNRLRAEWAIPALVLYVLSSILWWPPVCGAALGASLPIRLVVASVLLVPLGIGMGIPFPTGLAVMCRPGDVLIPWAWGVNGCVSVLASILASMVALAWGFHAVLVLAAMAYLAAWWLLLGGQRRKKGAALA